MSYKGEMNEGGKEEKKQRMGERGRGSDKRGDNGMKGKRKDRRKRGK